MGKNLRGRNFSEFANIWQNPKTLLPQKILKEAIGESLCSWDISICYLHSLFKSKVFGERWTKHLSHPNVFHSIYLMGHKNVSFYNVFWHSKVFSTVLSPILVGKKPGQLVTSGCSVVGTKFLQFSIFDMR